MKAATVNAKLETRNSKLPQRVLLALAIAAVLAAAGTGIYGVYKFPDAPIRETAAGYAGKGGTPRTREDFESFQRWKRVMFIAFPSAFTLGFAYALLDSRRRRTGAQSRV